MPDQTGELRERLARLQDISIEVDADEMRQLLSALDQARAEAERYRGSLEAIKLHAEMPDGETWEQAYLEVKEIADRATQEQSDAS